MRVAVIGAGSMGGMHADLLGAMEVVDRLFIVDADASRADEVARRAGASVVTFEQAVRPPVSSARDGLEAMRIAVAATRSHVEGRRVHLDEIAGLARTQVA